MWCPKCRTEYQDGVTVCSDCGTELVEGTEEEFDIVDICELKDQEMAQKLVDYLIYSKIEGARLLEEVDGVYVVVVPTKMQKKADKIFDGFKAVWKENKEKELEKAEAEDKSEISEMQDAEETQEARADSGDDQEVDLLVSDTLEDDPEELIYSGSEEFVSQADRYKDYMYSGITFVVFAVLGAVFMTLCKLEISPLHYGNVAFGIVIAMLVVFLLIGITSLVRARSVRKLISGEEAKTLRLKRWMQQNITKEMIADWKEADISEEENDLTVMAHIRAMLLKEFAGEDRNYLDMLAEWFFENPDETLPEPEETEMNTEETSEVEDASQEESESQDD